MIISGIGNRMKFAILIKSNLNYWIALSVIIVFSLLNPMRLFPQQFSTNSRRAIKFYDEAKRNFNLLEYADAKIALKRAVSVDSGFLEAWMLLGDVYRSENKFADARKAYDHVLLQDSVKYPEAYYFRGLSAFKLTEYEKALKDFTSFLRYREEGGRADEARFLQACSRFSIDAVKNPVPFEPVNLGKGVNTRNDEYINSVRADELQLYFTRRQFKDSTAIAGEDFYLSTRRTKSEVWGRAVKLPPPINTQEDEGALFITSDGRFLLFAGCNRPGGLGSCDIYAAKIISQKILEPVNLGPPVNTGAWETQPSLASDGRTLYFVSTRPGGWGESDIWKSYLQDDGHWSTPENLGETINTEGSEMAPFIHPDGQTLYFSSDRHPGLGGMDLFVSRLDSSGKWSEPENLGFPVNTSSDEINILVNAWGDKGYISSNQQAGEGGYDIFEFKLYDVVKPVPSTYMKGVVRDSVTKRSLEAYFSLKDLSTGKEIVRSFSDPSTGEFLVCIPANREYALSVSADGYLFYSENIALKGRPGIVKPHHVEIGLIPLRKGEAITLNNIFFKTDSSQLQPSSYVELNQLVDFLNSNPGIKVEIRGHTDNTGEEQYNLMLSTRRAKAVYDFLVGHGIDSRRLQYKGFGAAVPLAGNNTETGRAKNRRTEIFILENK